ncbi:TonB-dependent receptor [Dyella halodurans]|uniref:TonB-dependent receptor n=1 Tax=Dyella halodurans TaxID=1920171 RepID=A0ABV9C378_9GAMM|nr:TonB-dependent receptor [Dyella halodurans]
MQFWQLRQRRRCISVAVAIALSGSFAATAQPLASVGGDIAAPAVVNGDSAQGQVAATDAGAPAAQNPQSTSGNTKPVNLGTVMVTANKREERLQVVPMAVSALSGDDLRRQGANGFADYASQVPGLNLISTSVGQTQLVLRGITSGSSQSNSSVSTYIDDAPYGSSTVYAAGSLLTPDIDPADIERVEVLRGPQGTLYGSNSLGGLLKFVTAPPDSTHMFGRASVDYTSVDGGGSGFAERAMLNLPLVEGKLALRVNAYDRDNPGYIDNVFTGQKQVNESNVSGGRAQLMWTPTDKVEVRLSALAQNLRGDGLANTGVEVDPATLQPIYGYQKQSRAAGTGLLAVQYRLYDLSVDADFGWAKLVSSSSYGSQKVDQTGDVTAAYGPLLNPVFGLDNGGYSVTQPITLGKFTQELRLESPADQMLAWRAGVFYTRESTTNHESVNVFDASTGVPIDLPTLGDIHLGPAIFKEWAGYADVTWHATSQLSVLVGARQTHDSTSYTQVSSGLLTGAADFTTRSSDTPTTYLFNPSYQFTDNLMAYLRVATGFRPGGANVGVPPGLGAPLTFAPDKLTSYELGFKSTLLDQRMTFEADAFYIDWSQIQLTTVNANFVYLSNGGKAKSQGLEASWKYAPVQGLVLSTNASWTDAALTENTPPGLYGYNGDRLPWVPKWNASVGAEYNFPLGGGWSGFVGGSYNYVGRRESDFLSVPGPRISVPGYHGIDLHAGTYYGNWTIKGYVKNLTNQRGITSLASETTDPQGSPFAASYVPPRTIGVTLGLDF